MFSKCDHNGGIITSEVGIKLTICKNSIKEGDVLTFYIAVGFNGPFKFIPSDYGETDLNLSSPYYWIGVSGLYHFYRSIEVEFEHFGACDPSHYQLLCCEDDDKSNTMRAVDYELYITVKDGISLCRFLADHFCSYCLYHCYKDENKHTIAASYLMPNLNDLGFQNNFSVEIWFSYAITLCLNRNSELYERRGLKYVTGYLFEAPSNEKSTHCFTKLSRKD